MRKTEGEAEHKGGLIIDHGDRIKQKRDVISFIVGEDDEVCVQFARVYPGEQTPVGAASPEELQYLPGGQSAQPDLLDNPICLLKAPAGHGNATPDCVPVDK